MDEATRALWAAVRCLEDTVSAARWRQRQPDPPANLQGVIDKATGEGAVLRDVLRRWKAQDDAEQAAATGLHPPSDDGQERR